MLSMRLHTTVLDYVVTFDDEVVVVAKSNVKLTKSFPANVVNHVSYTALEPSNI